MSECPYCGYEPHEEDGPDIWDRLTFGVVALVLFLALIFGAAYAGNKAAMRDQASVTWRR